MRILLVTHLFAPRIGGIETMSLLLARAFINHGHDVHIVTATPSETPTDDHDMTVIRCPDRKTLAREVAWSSICFHNNICLSFSWPLIFGKRPWVVTTQTWIERADGSRGWREHLKRLLLRRARSISISRSIADSLPQPSTLIPNCYDKTIFCEPPAETHPEKHELVFAGRLVTSKGVDLAIESLAILARQHLHPRLTIIGEGPERNTLEALTASHGLAGQITFTGALQGVSLAHQFQRHQILLVPSRWAEPFGIVALEGAACGCLVLGSADGGLPDAIGPCGATFPNGDAHALAALIANSIDKPINRDSAELRKKHLLRHSIEAVSEAYLQLFEQLAFTPSKPS